MDWTCIIRDGNVHNLGLSNWESPSDGNRLAAEAQRSLKRGKIGKITGIESDQTINQLTQ